MDFSFRMPLERVHHHYLWFEDGSVVLECQDKADATRDILFRVHKGVLSKHSSVFAGMFTLPDASHHKGNKKADVNELYEGVPLIKMPDASDQIEAMLYAFYDPVYLKVDTRDPDFPVQLTPLMTAVQKYEVDTIGSYIKKQFEAAWPASLEEWDKAVRQEQNIDTDDAHSYVLEPASAIKFAREFDVKGVLTSAFYELSRCHYSESCPISGTTHKRNPEKKCARWSLLGAQDLLALGQVKEELERLPDGAKLAVHSLCFNGCRDNLNTAAKNIMLEASSTRDVLRVLQKCEKDGAAYSVFCLKCRERVSRRCQLLRSDLWTSIGRIVGNEAE